MEALLALYNSSPAKYELEFRVRNLDLSALRILFNSLMVEQQRSSSSNGRNDAVDRTREVVCYPSSLPQMRYIKRKQAGDSKYSGGELQRKVERRRVFIRNVKLVLSEESGGDDSDRDLSASAARIKSGDRCRFKSRVRVRVGDWFHDFTLVRDSNASADNLKRDLEEFESYGDIVDLTAMPPRTFMEYEIEHATPTPMLPEQAERILTSLVAPSTFRQGMYSLSKHVRISGNTLKRLLPSVIPLNVVSYRQLYPLANYYATYKLDGERAAAMVRGDSATVFTSGAVVAELVLTPSSGGEPSASQRRRPLHAEEEEWLDGEWYGDAFYAFDVVTPLQTGTEARMAALEAAVEKAAHPRLRLKPYVFLGSEGITECALAKVDELAADREIDGYVFLHREAAYFDKRRPVLKWKSGELSTVDLGMVLRTSSSNNDVEEEGRAAEEEYILTVTATPDLVYRYGLDADRGVLDAIARAGAQRPWDKGGVANTTIPYPFMTMLNPTLFRYTHTKRNGGGNAIEIPAGGWCIGEFRWDSDRWTLVRVRQDRTMGNGYYGNFYTVAESTWRNAEIPLTREALLSGNVGYFSKKDPRYTAQTKYSNAAKEYVYAKFIVHNAEVLDLGIGNGSDLFKYMQCHVRRVSGVDQDRDALHTLMSRFIDIRNSVGPQYRGKMEVKLFAMSFEELVATKELAHIVPVGSVDSVVWSFSFHYICYADSMVRQYAHLMSHVLAPGGTVIISIMDGNKLFEDILSAASTGQPKNEFRRNFADGTPKYHVTKDYSGDILESTGQRIRVLLPFSGGGYYSEFLVNTKFVDAAMREAGMELLRTLNMRDRDVADACRRQDANLSQDDRDYLALYEFRVYKKMSLN